MLRQTTAVIRGRLSDPGPTVLLVDDEEPLRQVLRARLTARGYLIQEASTGEDVLRIVPMLRPDIIVLDIGLPGIDGIEVTRRLRTSIQTPIIMLSVRASDSDKIAALNAGADDYLTKPCDLKDLPNRIRVALFRLTIGNAPVVALGDIVADLRSRSIRISGSPIQLTAKEYDLLEVFVLNAGRLLTQDRLAHEVWGKMSSDDALYMLRTTITTLRHKLDQDSKAVRPAYIEAEPGVGYRLHIVFPR